MNLLRFLPIHSHKSHKDQGNGRIILNQANGWIILGNICKLFNCQPFLIIEIIDRNILRHVVAVFLIIGINLRGYFKNLEVFNQ